jgi:hypothetical protein
MPQVDASGATAMAGPAATWIRATGDPLDPPSFLLAEPPNNDAVTTRRFGVGCGPCVGGARNVTVLSLEWNDMEGTLTDAMGDLVGLKARRKSGSSICAWR